MIEYLKRLQLFFLLFLPVNSCFAGGMRPGEAKAEIRDGKLCFSVPSRELEAAHGSLNVTGYMVGRAPTPAEFNPKFPFAEITDWGYRISEPILFQKGDCIFYGELPKGAEVLTLLSGPLPSVGPPLKINTGYSVSISVKKNKYNAMTMGYGTAFCLQKNADGELIVHNVRGSCSNIKPDEE